MTQGAGQGPGMWQGGGAAGDEPGGPAAAEQPAGPVTPTQSAQAAQAAQPTPPVPAGAPAAPEAPVTATVPGAAAVADPAGSPPAELDPDYTPTARDLPVVSASPDADDEETDTLIDFAAQPVPSGEEGDGPLFVVGDVHGYLDELRAALHEAGIIDGQDDWCAGNTRLWFLGDFTDRGPDGVGVIDLVMNLSAQAAAAGGYCKALMGNHELLLLGAKKFGDTPVSSGAGTASFKAAWLLNGGQRTDMERLEDHHVQWMSRLDALTLADGHLLLHSDATCYLDYGDTIDSVNDAVTEAVQRNDAEETWELFRKFTKRFAFRDDDGADTARELLDRFGGTRVVHGHSPIPYLLGEDALTEAVEKADGDEDLMPEVTGPHLYADGLAVAMDGGVTMDGKLLVTRLPLSE